MSTDQQGPWQSPVLLDYHNKWMIYRGICYKFATAEGVASLRGDFLDAIGAAGTMQ